MGGAHTRGSERGRKLLGAQEARWAKSTVRAVGGRGAEPLEFPFLASLERPACTLDAFMSDKIKMLPLVRQSSALSQSLSPHYLVSSGSFPLQS